MNEFVNALQLSISSKIDRWSWMVGLPTASHVIFYFNNINPDDENLYFFQKLIPGTWDNAHKIYTIIDVEPINSLTTQFLLLTRLNKKNILKLAELDEKYKILAQKIYGTSVELSDTVGSIENASKIIFDEVQRQKLTIRQLAEKTGLSAVAISNFKAGKDIRLSTLIKICQILGLKISIARP